VVVEVGANVGSAAEAAAARSSGADLVGLVRTEFLFLGRSEAPDVDEQAATYRAIAEAMGGRRITLRTLDVGGDKPLPYVEQPAEVNPFLGLRGLRLSLARPALLAAQLTAVVRVAKETPISVMFPMVATLGELLLARSALDEAVREEAAGQWPAGLQVGVMVEIPALALKARSVVPHVDFLSIGTNDLAQYALAAERGNPSVADLGDALDPGVLWLIGAVCAAASDQALVAVCGELAGDPVAVAALIGLGVRELSVAPPAVPAIKQAVRTVDARAATSLAEELLTLPDAAAARSRLAPAPRTCGSP
jgi:phosphocarrier protein FPr